VTKTLKCADTGIVCRTTVTGDTEEEVLEKAAKHAREDHGVDITRSTTLVGFARGAIRDEDEPEER
jgi:predicted small metal-binding protein